MSDNCVKSYSSWNAFFFTFTAFGYSNNQREATLLQNVKKQKLNFENHWHLCFFTAMLITYIKGGTPAHIFLEMGSAMTRATFVIFWPKLSSFIDWCCYSQVSYTGSWEPLVCIYKTYYMLILFYSIYYIEIQLHIVSKI
jgi:hypothetical protein